MPQYRLSDPHVVGFMPPAMNDNFLWCCLGYLHVVGTAVGAEIFIVWFL